MVLFVNVYIHDSYRQKSLTLVLAYCREDYSRIVLSASLKVGEKGRCRMSEDMKLMPRTITVQLSNDHCNDILKLCGKRNLTVGQLLETFLKSLLGESSAVMANDVYHAEQWLEQYTLYNVPPKKTLLMFLYEEGIEAGDFTQLYYDIAITEGNIRNIETFGGSSEELKEEEADLREYEAEFKDYKTRYLAENPGADWETQVEKVKQWSYEACHLQYGMDIPSKYDDESEEGFL